MSGYQEILTDPSYKGQLVCMTYPEIGNVGINPEDEESARIFVEGFIVKEYLASPSNWRAQMTLGEYLDNAGIVGIDGIDTRALVRHIRTAGAQQAVISSANLNPDGVDQKSAKRPRGCSAATWSRKSPVRSYDWELADWELGSGYRRVSGAESRDAPLVVALDYGIKRNILQRLVATGFRVKVLPAFATADECCAESRRNFPLERSRRSGRRAICVRDRATTARRETDFRHLPGPSDSRTGARRQDLQARLWPSRRESSGDGFADRARRDHLAKSWLRGGSRLAPGTGRAFARESQR